jgi:hypothetical protein
LTSPIWAPPESYALSETPLRLQGGRWSGDRFKIHFNDEIG